MGSKGYIVDRQKGESYENWKRRCHRFNLEQWRESKKEKGNWLSKKEYERRTGKCGMKD